MNSRYNIHIILFLLTLLTTMATGALMSGYDIFSNPSDITKGLPYSITILLILTCHEFGHYIFARIHKVDATLPYFIPIPPPITIFGTLGAFIRIRDTIPNRRALLEIGAAGPIAGFVVAVPVLLYGLTLSNVVDLSTIENSFYLGDALLLKLATYVMFPGLGEHSDIMLHPIAFAGWIGLLVTMINLIPIGQLDGGHIAYALLGKKHDTFAKIMFVGLLIMGITVSVNWLVWAVLIVILMRSVKHPPILNEQDHLTKRDKLIGIICIIIFILCFIPAPLSTNM